MFVLKFRIISTGLLLLTFYTTSAVFGQQQPGTNNSNGTDTIKVGNVGNVIFLGYNSIRRQNVTGAISGVTDKDLREMSPVSVDALLKGRAAGLNVVNVSGAPGSGALNIIRGTATLNGGTTPLYIVDGIPVKATRFANPLAANGDNNPLADINPEDIESVTVLKDAQATAIYGMRGGRGVVLINTYGGTSGKTYLDVTASSGIMDAPDPLSVLDADQYHSFTLEKERARGFTDSQINRGVGRYLLLSTPASQVERYNNNTNWQKEALGRGMLSNFHLNLRGGDAVARYSLNVGYTQQDGVITNTDFNRFSTRFNLDYKVGRKLSFLNSLTYSYTNRKLKDEGSAFNTNPLYLASLKSPTLTTFEQDNKGTNLRTLDSADYAGRNNPYSVLNRMRAESNTNRITGKIFAQYTFSPYLSLRIGLAFDYFRLSENRFVPSAGFRPEGYIIRSSSQANNSELMLLNENVLTYNRTSKSGLHNVNAFIGASYQNTSQEAKYGRQVNSTSDELSRINTSDPLQLDSIDSYSPTWKLLSFFGSINYTFKGKYIVGANLRADGSSRFLEGKQWGYFPSLSAAWRVGAEDFLKNNKVISELKLRASYGIVGNDEVGYYNSFNSIISAPYTYSGTRFGIIGNPDFQWEQTAQVNVGIDVEVLKSRMGATVDVYQRKTKNLYNIINIPRSSGFDNYAVSDGSVTNRGVELSVWGKILNGAFGWQTNLSAARNHNEINALPSLMNTVFNYGNFSMLAQPGTAIGSFYGYNTQGVYANTADVNVKNGVANTNPFQGGDVIFEDVNGDGIIDVQDMKVIGNTNPDLYGGFSNIFSYKNFDLNVFVDFASGNQVYNAQRAALESMSTYDNQSTTVLNRWRTAGDATNIPRALQGDAVGNTRFSTRWLEDGSYLRFRALTVGYNFPLKGMLKGVFTNARVMVTAQNLHTFSNYKGFSPEAGSITNPIMYGVDYGNVPQLRAFLLGVKLGL